MKCSSIIRARLVSAAIVVIVGAALAGSAGAASSSGTQHIAIDAKIPWHLTGATFKLVPPTSAPIRRDAGQVVFSAGGRSTRGVRDG